MNHVKRTRDALGRSECPLCGWKLKALDASQQLHRCTKCVGPIYYRSTYSEWITDARLIPERS